MTTTDAISMTNQNYQLNNMYNPWATTMANDFFGSQVFGGTGCIFPTNTMTGSTPNNDASAILEAYRNSQGYGQMTAQDYMNMNNMINYYANQVPLLYNTSSFMANDIFAQQLPQNFCQTNPAVNLNYTA